MRGKGKAVMKQATLFGLQPRELGAKEVSSKQAESAMTDTNMDILDNLLVRRTPEMESQEETQLVENAADNIHFDVATVSATITSEGNDDGEPIEWPASPCA